MKWQYGFEPIEEVLV